MQKAKVERKTMKKSATWQSCCMLLSVAMAIAPVVQAADQEPIRTAKAIGEESTLPPTTPKKRIKPPISKEKTVPVVPVTPAETPVEKTVEAPVEKTPDAATESESISNTAIYIGIGIAVLLAAAGGGGGGGGGSSTPPHPQQ
jgi:hypothetical protein